MNNLIFIFSLPRSGSTWLQRLLASNENVISTPESWLLLPLFEVLFKGRALTEYNQHVATIAQAEFFEKLQLDRGEFEDTVVNAYRDLFAKAAGADTNYFLEKTPRNYLVLDRIIKHFPDSKFIFLWRDPADIALSLSRSYAGRWNTFFRYEVDFEVGIRNMVKAAEALGDKACMVRYEDARESPNEALDSIYRYIGLEAGVYEENEIGRERIKGTYGDKSYLGGAYRGPISRSEKNSICKVLNNIDSELYAFMGYDRQKSVEKVKSQKTRLFEFRNIAHPFLNWAYHNQMAASMHRWRGEPTGFPDYGVE